MNELLTSPEVAQALRITEPSLKQQRYHGRGPNYLRIGRAIRYRRSEVEHYLHAHEVMA